MNILADKILLNDFWTASTVPIPLTKRADFSNYYSAPFASGFSSELPDELPQVLLSLDGLYPLSYYLSDHLQKLEHCTFIVDRSLENKIPLALREHMLFYEIHSREKMSFEELNKECEELILHINENTQDLQQFDQNLKLLNLKKISIIIPDRVSSGPYSVLLASIFRIFPNEKIDFYSSREVKNWKKKYKTTLYIDLNDKKKIAYPTAIHHFLSQGCLTLPKRPPKEYVLQTLELSRFHDIFICEGSSSQEEIKWLSPSPEERLTLKKAFIFQELILSEEKEPPGPQRFFENNLDCGILIESIGQLYKEIQQEFESEQWIRR